LSFKKISIYSKQMANLEVKTEKYNVVANDSVFTYKGENLAIEFNNSMSVRSKINFIFSKNPEKEQKIEARPAPDSDYLDITIYNAVGVGGTTEPLKIAEDVVNKKIMYISLSFQQFSDSFLINYTVFENK
jgi:hypothetical protein